MATVDAQTIWDLAGALQSQAQAKTQQRIVEVTRIDKDGTVWVHVPGGVDETPVRNVTAEVSIGDTAIAQWRDNGIHILGNTTAPATSARAVEAKVDEAMAPVARKVDAAASSSEAAKIAATEAAEVANAINQHFWHDDNGAHVTDDTQEAWEGEYAKEGHGDLANPTDEKPWYNQLIGSAGTLLRSGLKNLASWTRSSVAFFDGQDDGAENVLASFGANGIQIGLSSAQHVVVDDGGMCIFGADGDGFSPLYFAATPAGVVMENPDSEIRQVLSSTRNSFRTDAGEIAWFGRSDDGIWEMHIDTTYAEDMVRFGDYAWIKRQNGNMTIKWLGE